MYHSDYLPRGPSESARIREFASQQLELLRYSDIINDKLEFKKRLQSLTNEIIGIPSQKKEVASNRHMPDLTKGMSNMPLQVHNEHLTADMREPSLLSLEKLKIYRQSLQRKVGSDVHHSGLSSGPPLSAQYGSRDGERQRNGERHAHFGETENFFGGDKENSHSNSRANPVNYERYYDFTRPSSSVSDNFSNSNVSSQLTSNRGGDMPQQFERGPVERNPHHHSNYGNTAATSHNHSMHSYANSLSFNDPEPAVPYRGFQSVQQSQMSNTPENPDMGEQMQNRQSAVAIRTTTQPSSDVTHPITSANSMQSARRTADELSQDRDKVGAPFSATRSISKSSGEQVQETRSVLASTPVARHLSSSSEAVQCVDVDGDGESDCGPSVEEDSLADTESSYGSESDDEVQDREEDDSQSGMMETGASKVVSEIETDRTAAESVATSNIDTTSQKSTNKDKEQGGSSSSQSGQSLVENANSQHNIASGRHQQEKPENLPETMERDTVRSEDPPKEKKHLRSSSERADKAAITATDKPVSSDAAPSTDSSSARLPLSTPPASQQQNVADRLKQFEEAAALEEAQRQREYAQYLLSRTVGATLPPVVSPYAVADVASSTQPPSQQIHIHNHFPSSSAVQAPPAQPPATEYPNNYNYSDYSRQSENVNSNSGSNRYGWSSAEAVTNMNRNSMDDSRTGHSAANPFPYDRPLPVLSYPSAINATAASNRQSQQPSSAFSASSSSGKMLDFSNYRPTASSGSYSGGHGSHSIENSIDLGATRNTDKSPQLDFSGLSLERRRQLIGHY